jgi:hypothetical protein
LGWRDEFGGKWCAVEAAGFRAAVGVDSAVEATFLKVIVHLTSSPAKTTCSCQRTKTRMLLLVLVLLLALLLLLLGPSGGMVQAVEGAEGGTRSRELKQGGVRECVRLPRGKGNWSPESSGRSIQHF